MWYGRIERGAVSRGIAIALTAPLLPVLAAAFQSAWIVFIRGNRIYQAMLYPYQPYTETTNYWRGDHALLWQVLISAAMLWPLAQFPQVHRLLAVLIFGACLYYDCCVVTQVVIR